jgi:hypothetical protein
MVRRAVIIYHPDFDADGAAGVKAAKDMVDQFQNGNTAILSEVERKGVKPEELARFKFWISQLEYFIRNVEL